MSDWLSPAVEYIASWIELQHRHLDLPGIAIAIRDRSGLRLDTAFGVADCTAGTRLTRRHRFRVASHSKTFTAAGIMKLREAGRVRLDDSVGQYVDGLAAPIAKATLAQLLSHTAGICRDGTDAAQWSDRGPFLNEEALRRDLAAAPVIDANTRMKYSNHGYGLLGLVIEKLTGEPYTRWMHREVIDAAGLEHTYPDAPLPAQVPFSRGHTGKLLLGERLVIPGDNPTHALASATGFVSTAADLTRFFLQLGPSATDSLLGVGSRRELTRRQWRIPDIGMEMHYGLGTVQGNAGGWAWFGHSGGFQGYITQTAVVPAQQIAVSILTNSLDGPPALLVDGCLRILELFARHGAPSKATRDWSGRWWSLWGAVDLIPTGDVVIVANPALPNPLYDATELTVARKDAARISKTGGFASYGESARLVRDRRGRVSEVRLAATRLKRAAALAREIRRRYARREP